MIVIAFITCNLHTQTHTQREADTICQLWNIRFINVCIDLWFLFVLLSCNLVRIRKRSSKCEDDGFTFPDLSAVDKCELEVLDETQVQKFATLVPVTQHHVFAEPKPKVSKKCAKTHTHTNWPNESHVHVVLCSVDKTDLFSCVAIDIGWNNFTTYSNKWKHTCIFYTICTYKSLRLTFFFHSFSTHIIFHTHTAVAAFLLLSQNWIVFWFPLVVWLF